MSDSVHVILPPFSRLCLVCSGHGTLPVESGRLEVILGSPEARSALGQLLPSLHQHLPLTPAVCHRCRRLLLTWQLQWQRQHTAAAAISHAYQQGDMARSQLSVRLRRGRQAERQVALREYLQSGNAPAAGHLTALVSQLVKDTFGSDALAGTLVVDCEQMGQDRGPESGQKNVAEELDEESQQRPILPHEQSRSNVRDLVPACLPKDVGCEESEADVVSSASSEAKFYNEDGPCQGFTSSQASKKQGSICRSTRARQLRSRDPKVEYSSEESESRGPGEGRSAPRLPLPAGIEVESSEWEPQNWAASSSAVISTKKVLNRRRDRPNPRKREENSCHMCRRSFRSPHGLQVHVEKLHKFRSAVSLESVRVWCPACTNLIVVGDVRSHVIAEHAGRLNCSCCGINCDTAEAAADHCVSVHTAHYMCIVCLEIYSSHQLLVRHMNGNHSGKSPGCPGDESRPTTSPHPVSTVYEDLVHRLKTRARRRQLQLLGSTTVQCPYCAQTCSLHYLRTHLYKHKAAGFRCGVCEKAFKFPVSYQRHLQLHAGLTEKCPHCEAVFSDRTNLRSHLVSHTDDKKFACDRCAKRFKYKQTRDAHAARVHSSGAARVCHVCGASFPLQYQLTVHLARHKNERKLPCPLCSKTFELNLDLKRHLYSKHRLRVAEVERRFPEIRRRPNTLLDTTSLDEGPSQVLPHAALEEITGAHVKGSLTSVKASDTMAGIVSTETAALLVCPTEAEKTATPASTQHQQCSTFVAGTERQLVEPSPRSSSSDSVHCMTALPLAAAEGQAQSQTPEGRGQISTASLSPQPAISPPTGSTEHPQNQSVTYQSTTHASADAQAVAVEVGGVSGVRTATSSDGLTLPSVSPMAADQQHHQTLEGVCQAEDHSSPVLLLVGGSDVGVLIENVLSAASDSFVSVPIRQGICRHNGGR